MVDLDSLRYPVGRSPRTTGPLDPATREEQIAVIERLPADVRALVDGIPDPRLAASYRPGGWTVRQLVHHLADSHMNAYVRMKLAATEESPAVKTYEEARWAELPDARSAPIAMSLALLEGLHQRWTIFLRGLPPGDFTRAFSHPEWGRVTIDGSILMYAWHCRHHTAHIALALRT